MMEPLRIAPILAPCFLLVSGTVGAQIDHTPPSLTDNTYTLRAVPIDHPDDPLFDPSTTVIGDFDRDGLNDVAFLDLAENRVSVLRAPGIHEDLEQGPWNVEAMAAMPLAGGGDDLLLAGSQGLSRRYRNQFGWVNQSLSANWTDVVELATLVAADGSVEIFGLDDDLRTVRRLLWNGQQVLADGVLFQAALTLQALVPIRRPGGQGTGLAVLTSDALAIADLSGVVLLWVPAGGPGWTADAICRVSHEGVGHDWVASVVTAADGESQFLGLADENGTFAPAVAWTGKYGIRLENEDLNGDGLDDLLVTSSESPSVSVLQNQGGATPLFGLGNEVLFTPPGNPLPSGEEYHGLAAAADLDGDGDADLVVTTRSGRLAVFRGTTVIEANWKVRVTNHQMSNEALLSLGPPGTSLELDIDPPTVDLVALGATHLEVEVFLQQSSADAAGGQTSFDPTATYRIDVAQGWPSSVTVEIPGGGGNSGDLYYVSMRGVQRVGNETVKVFPGAVYGVHVNHWAEVAASDPVWTEYLTDLAGSDAGLFAIHVKPPWSGDDDIGRGSDVPIIPDDEEEGGE